MRGSEWVRHLYAGSARGVIIIIIVIILYLLQTTPAVTVGMEHGHHLHIMPHVVASRQIEDHKPDHDPTSVSLSGSRHRNILGTLTGAQAPFSPDRGGEEG